MDNLPKKEYMPELKATLKRRSSETGNSNTSVIPSQHQSGQTHNLPRTSNETGSMGTRGSNSSLENQQKAKPIRTRSVPQPPGANNQKSQVGKGEEREFFVKPVTPKRTTSEPLECTSVIIPDSGVYGSAGAKDLVEQEYKTFDEIFQKGVIVVDFSDDIQNLRLKHRQEIQFVEDRYSPDFVFLELNRTRYRVPRNLIVPVGDLRINSWFHGAIDRKEAEKLILENCGNGGFLIRQRPADPNTYGLTMIQERHQKKEIAHYIIKVVRHGQKDVFYIKPNKVFDSLEELVEHYKTDGTDLLTTLNKAAPKLIDIDDHEYISPMDIQTNDDEKTDKVKLPANIPTTNIPPQLPARKVEELPKQETPLSHQIEESLVQTDKNPFSGENGVIISYKAKMKVEGNKEKDVILQKICPELFPGDFPSFAKEFLKNCAVGLQNAEFFVNFYGFCVPQKAIIHEYITKGTLKDELIKHKKSDSKRLDYAKQISDAMLFLESQAIVHGNLSARNIFLEGKRLKIGDVGLKKLIQDTLNISDEKKMQLETGRWRWAAPEGAPITQKSDVWSYAMVLLEINSGGKDPLEEIKTEEDYRNWKTTTIDPKKPAGCHRLLYERVLVKCCDRKPMQRPSFKNISEYIEALLA